MVFPSHWINVQESLPKPALKELPPTVFSSMCRDLLAREPSVGYAKFKSAVEALVRDGKTVKSKPKESPSTRGAEHYRRLVRTKRQTTCTEDGHGR